MASLPILAARQEPNYLVVAIGLRPVGGGPSIQPLKRRIGAASEEDGDGRGLAFLGRPDQGGPVAAALLVIEVGPLVEQQLYQFAMAPGGRQHEGCIATLVLGIGIGAARQ